jgi:hypothetical protein
MIETDGMKREARAALERRPDLRSEIYEIVALALAEIEDCGSPTTESERAIEDIHELLTTAQ